MRKIVFAVLAALSLTAAAQQRPAELQPVPPPPPLPAGADDFEPQVTIIQRGDDKVEEFRVNGKLYMQKITPKHGASYVLLDERGDGQWRRVDATDSGLRVPQWVIKTW